MNDNDFYDEYGVLDNVVQIPELFSHNETVELIEWFEDLTLKKLKILKNNSDINAINITKLKHWEVWFDWLREELKRDGIDLNKYSVREK